MKVIAFFCTKFSTIPCANLQALIQLIIHFILYVKKRKYIILHSCHQGENTIALPTFIFPWAGKNFSVGKQKKKNKSAIKTHSNKEKKYPSEKKKLPSHGKIVHTNRTLIFFIKKGQMFHYLYRFI